MLQKIKPSLAVYNNDELNIITEKIQQIITDAELTYTINWHIKPTIFPDQPKEFYYGCREYKRHIIDETIYPANVNKDVVRRKYINKKATQLLFRLNEGNGRALYLIGVEDNGTAIGIRIDEVLGTLVNFICMTDIIHGSSIRTFNMYKTQYGGFVCTIRIGIVNYECMNVTAII
jgi:hypothetical protein